MQTTADTQNGIPIPPSLTDFHGFQAPTTTPVPDEVFDRFLDVLSGAELKVLLYIIRRTLGFKKSHDSIALSQMLNGITTRDGDVLDRGCGVKDKKSVLQALRNLEDWRLIVAYRQSDLKKGNLPTLYGLNVAAGPPPLGGKSRQGGWEKSPSPLVGKSPQGLGGEIPPHNMTDLQQTEQQQQQPVTVPVSAAVPSSNGVVASDSHSDEREKCVEQPTALFETLVQLGVTRGVAQQILKAHSETTVAEQLAALPFRSNVQEPAAILVRAIRDNWALPQAYRRSLKKAERERERQAARISAASKAAETQEREAEEAQQVKRYLDRLSAEALEALEEQAMGRLLATWPQAPQKREGAIFRSFLNLLVKEALGLGEA